MEEIKPQRRWPLLPETSRKQAETRALVERLLPGEQCILLDERGQHLDSIGLSRWLENFHLQSAPQVSFLVGGPYGVDQETFPKQTKQLSLSPMTFSHQMVRLILLEQVYRAFTILNGEPYHHY
jgi:23S rRNA (pseudouridine1915-N3)-methyltransferase